MHESSPVVVHGESGVKVDHSLLSFLANSRADVNTGASGLAVVAGSAGGVGSGDGVIVNDVGVVVRAGSSRVGLASPSGPLAVVGASLSSGMGTVGLVSGGVMILVGTSTPALVELC